MSRDQQSAAARAVLRQGKPGRHLDLDDKADRWDSLAGAYAQLAADAARRGDLDSYQAMGELSEDAAWHARQYRREQP